jgi:serine-type D-Ala-D-Ala carboxypeptidase/endopeptidase (penicillin-binding protein 4)
VTNRVLTLAPGSPGARLNVHRRIDRPELEISGGIASDAKPVTRTVAVLNPTLFFSQSLKDALIARGIAVGGDAADVDDVSAELVSAPAVDRRVLVTTQSPPLREIATVLMKISQNQYAETLLKAIGAKTGGIGTTDAGRAAAIATFTSWNIPRDGYVMSDGSGLSRYNYIAPSTITTILRRMYADPVHRDAFLATLPVAGKDGTISSRMRKTRAAENARAKTGSIANTRSLSGFVTTRDGETLVFSMLANDFVIPSATVDWIVDLAVETLANFTRR